MVTGGEDVEDKDNLQIQVDEDEVSERAKQKNKDDILDKGEQQLVRDIGQLTPVHCAVTAAAAIAPSN